MKALVLGGAGFIGRHLAKRILEDGGEVIAVDNLDTSRLCDLAELISYDKFTFVNEDLKTISDEELFGYCTQSDVVYHLAGSVGVQLGDKEPKRTLYNNLDLMMKIMPVFESAGTHVVFASTSEVYGNGPTFREDDPAGIGPSKYTRWAYSTTKLMSEFMLRVSNVPHNIIRFFNIVGPGQLPDYGMVLPKFVEAARSGDPIEVHGNGEQIRSFCHIDDAVEMLLRVMDHPGELFNIGNSDNAVSMLELAHMVGRRFDAIDNIKMVDYKEIFSDRFEDIMYRVPNTEKIREYTKYEPKYTMYDIIEDLV
jgi:UDP-glucose 4-epimerase